MCCVPLGFQCVERLVNERNENRDGENVSEIFRGGDREWRFPSLFYKDDLVLCGESEEDMRVMIAHFAEVCKRKDFKVNADKKKMMFWKGRKALYIRSV